MGDSFTPPATSIPALDPAVVGPQTILLHIQQLVLKPVGQHELLFTQKFVQLRDQIDR